MGCRHDLMIVDGECHGENVFGVADNQVPHCGMCGQAPASQRLYACVACAVVSCHLHAATHLTEQSLNHAIVVDVDRAELFCCTCRDQVYDCDFDAAVVLAQTAASTLGGGPTQHIMHDHSPSSL